MVLTSPVRKFILTVHVAASVGWVGALAAFFAHALAGWISEDATIVRAVSIAMGISAWYVILPLSLTSFTTGVIQALGTAWGLLRHYWIVFKLLLTAVATIVLLLKLGPITRLAEAAGSTTFSGTDLPGLRSSLTIHAAAGLLVLLTAATLAVYKPRGLTSYGLRRQQRDDPGTESRITSTTSTPTWATVLGVAFVILILIVLVMLAGGGHGPGAHLAG